MPKLSARMKPSGDSMATHASMVGWAIPFGPIVYIMFRTAGVLAAA